MPGVKHLQDGVGFTLLADQPAAIAERGGGETGLRPAVQGEVLIVAHQFGRPELAVPFDQDWFRSSLSSVASASACCTLSQYPLTRQRK